MIIKEYSSKDGEGRNRIFLEVECDNCKSTYQREKRQFKGIFHGCSPLCLSILKGTRIATNCDHCGNIFYRTPSELLKSKSGKHFCSVKCKDKAVLYMQEIRPEHYNNSVNYRKRAIREYGEICQLCGFDNPFAIVVHHIDEDRNNNELDNLIVLCANCHYIAHKGNFKK